MHDCTSILDSNAKGTLLVPMIFRILDPYIHQHLFIFALVPHIFCAQFLYSRGSRGKGSYISGFLVLILCLHRESIDSLIYMQRYLAANICAVCRVEYRQFSKKLNISIHKYTTHYQEMRSH